MAWEESCRSWRYEEERENGDYWHGMLDQASSIKVMTDDQIEILRRQISIYATICEQLVEMHRAFTAQQESLAGMRMEGMCCYPSISAEIPKSIARQRWSPTPIQLQILEGIFKLGNGTPSKQKISEITSELSNHGQASDVKVYNWFQNRRARSKKKQVAQHGSNIEFETEVDVELPNGKKLKFDKIHVLDNLLHPEPNRTEGMNNLNDMEEFLGTQKQMPF